MAQNRLLKAGKYLDYLASTGFQTSCLEAGQGEHARISSSRSQAQGALMVEEPSPVPEVGSPRGLGFTWTAHLLPASRPRCSCWTQPPSSRCLFPQSLPYPQECRPLQLHMTLQQRFLWKPLQLLMLPGKRDITVHRHMTITGCVGTVHRTSL